MLTGPGVRHSCREQGGYPRIWSELGMGDSTYLGILAYRHLSKEKS